MVLPFSERRKKNSQDFYGRCVSYWVTITPHVPYVKNPDIVVFVTYPMNVEGGKYDENALSMLKYIRHKKSTAPIVLVTHRSGDIVAPQLETIEQFVPRNQITFLFLGEHTMNTARSILESKFAENGTLSRFIVDPVSFKTEYLYPVVPKEFLTHKGLKSYQLKSPLEHLWNIILNVMKVTPATKAVAPPNLQSFHEDSSRLYECLHASSRVKSSSLAALSTNVSSKDILTISGTHLREYLKRHKFIQRSERGALFSIQGNFGGKHSYRKDPRGTVKCLKEVESSALLLQSVSADDSLVFDLKKHPHCASISSFFDASSPIAPVIMSNKPHESENVHKNETNRLLRSHMSDHSPYSVHMSLDLVGHISGELNIDKNTFETGKIRFLSDLSSKSFYTAISRSRFMIGGLRDREYLTTRASSSVPAALIGEIPLITSNEILDIYPCLRDAPMHRKIARSGECEAMEMAFWLSEEEYQIALKEIKTCSEKFFNDAKMIFKKIIDNRITHS